jgi:NTE family protein
VSSSNAVPNPKRNGLVLTAGGARGAYQAGVLKRIGEQPRFRGKPSPFRIVTGASAGAINGALVAAMSADFGQGTQRLADLWDDIGFDNVFRTDALSLSSGAARWIRDLSFGGMMGGGDAQSLLDASPLRGFLAKALPLDGIARAINEGHLYAVGIAATSYYSGKSYTFIQGQAGHPLWAKSRRASEAVPLSIDHICASAAIPVVFQPVLLKTDHGDFYFGDGGLRLTTPLSPAIRLGADRVFAIGIRSQESAEARSKAELLKNSGQSEGRPQMRPPPLAQVFGVALNAIFLDHLDADLEHLQRMNGLIGSHALAAAQAREPMRAIEAFGIYPSQDLASVAETYGRRMPKLVRYFMEGLGTSHAQSADLMSYLLFDSDYTRTLIDIGYKDAASRIDEIEQYLLAP